MRSKIVLAAALLMGIITTVLFFNYMKQFDEASASSKSLVSVVSAKQAIKENTIITAGMLELKQIPAGAAHAQAVANVQEAAGKVAASSLIPGEILLSHHLKDQKEEAMFVSKKVREGYRAVSIGVNIVQSVSNLIEPGDYVDVVYSKKDKGTDKLLSQIILENVHVLAIGRRMVEAEPDTPYAEYAQVTLELTPANGVEAINADEDPDAYVSLMLHSRVLQDQKKEQSQKTK